MTGEYGHAIVIAKLRHCAKFRCTEVVLHRIVDGILGRGGKRKRERDREREGGGNRGFPVKKGVRKATKLSSRQDQTREERAEEGDAGDGRAGER